MQMILNASHVLVILILLSIIIAIGIIVFLFFFLRLYNKNISIVMDMLKKNIKDVVTYNKAMFIYTIFYQAIERSLLLKCYNIIDNNHIHDIDVQKSIIDELKSELVTAKNNLFRALNGISCNNIDMSDFIDQTENYQVHDNMIELLTKIIFSGSFNSEKKKRLVETQISTYYKNRYSAAIEYLRIGGLNT